MTEREASVPKPFGYVRDNSGDVRIFQHAPFTENEQLLCSTAPVYSYAQMVEFGKASRQQAMEEAAKECGRISTEYRDAYKGRGDEVRRDQLYNPHTDGCSDGANDCEYAIRALSHPTGGKE